MDRSIARRTLVGAGLGTALAAVVGCSGGQDPTPGPSSTTAAPSAAPRRVVLEPRRIPITPFGSVRSSALVGGLLLVEGIGNRHVRTSCIDLAAGKELWTRQRREPLPAGSPDLEPSMVLGHTSGQAPMVLFLGHDRAFRELVIAADLRTGEHRWNVPAAGNEKRAFGDDDLVITSTNDTRKNAVVALDARTGQERWAVRDRGGATCLSAGHVLGWFGDQHEGPLVVRERATGAEVTRSAVPTERAEWVDAIGDIALAEVRGEVVVIDLAADRRRATVKAEGRYPYPGARLTGTTQQPQVVGGGERSALSFWTEGDDRPVEVPVNGGTLIGFANGVAWAAEEELGSPAVPVDRDGPLAGGPGVPLEAVDESWVVEAVTPDLPVLVAHAWKGVR